ncbi:hypothetical protein [Pseudomarimonas arenosa]|uniref:Uncharacterized protein n=1 Tax=Pseudomarimonas arenosa TaxID=2774145 RepID=A0AAW3ZLJ7_9GAMM|nr:hypothetical protein [Pseudomarimonas arenosa]MBD8525790.1 hypothetical protein [Pseudomarimonas arenosa]
MPGLLPASSVQIPEPGYLVIDDAWYGFGVRDGDPATEATLSPLGARGFHLKTVLDIGGCERGSGLPPSPLLIGQSALSVSDLPADQQPEPPTGSPPLLPAEASTPAQLRLATCDDTVVMFVRSVDGDLNCQMRLGFPFARRADCPSLNAADWSYVFSADFD